MKSCSKRKILTLVSVLNLALVSSTVGWGLTLNEEMIQEIEHCLSKGTVGTMCDYPHNWRNLSEPLEIHQPIVWSTPATLQLISKEDIVFGESALIKSQGEGNVILKAGMENALNKDYRKTPRGKIIFKNKTTPYIVMKEGVVRFYYNPEKEHEDHKYWNAISYSYEQQIEFQGKKDFTAYMLVNHVQDLQNMEESLYGNYALSQDIDAVETKEWDNGKGFSPLKDSEKGEKGQPFSGHFDGNGYTISHFYINRPEEDKVGLFGMCSGFKTNPGKIENLVLKDPQVTGHTYVGSLCGWSTYNLIRNVTITNPTVTATDIAGGIIGTSLNSALDFITIHNVNIKAKEYKGIVAGGGNSLKITLTETSQGVLDRILELLKRDEPKSSSLPMIGYDHNKKSVIGVHLANPCCP